MINFLIIGCTLIVIRAKNPVHSLFSLILVFLNTAILLIQSGIEYIGIFIIIVYIGAIAILFLFVIMMLNMKLVLRHQAQKVGTHSADRVGQLARTAGYLPMIFFIFYSILFTYALRTQFPKFSIADYNTSLQVDLSSPMLSSNRMRMGLEQIFDLISSCEHSIIIIGKVLYTYQFFYFLLCGIVLLLGMYGAIILTFSPLRQSIHLQNIYLQNSRLLNNNTFNYESLSYSNRSS